MSDQARIKVIQDDIKNDVQLQLKKFMDAMNIRDRDHARRIDSLEVSNEGRLNRIETAVESLLRRAAEDQQDETNSHTRRTPFHTKSVKLEFPRFDSTHAIEWVFKAEQFFEYYNTPDEDRLMIAAVHLDQKVVPWYQMMQRTNPFQSWQLFARAIEVDFGPSCYDCPRATLFKLTQKSTVAEYYMEFTSLANRVYVVSTEAMLDCFVSGLQPDLQREVIAQEPSCIQRAVDLAKLFEEKCKPITRNQPNHSTTKPNTFNNPNPNRTTIPPLLPTPNSKPTNTYSKNQNVKNMTSAEMQIRREKGLCYTCDDKWSFSHKCPNRHLMILQTEEDDTDYENVSVNQVDTGGDKQLKLHLSFKALRGAIGVGTIKFTGHIGKMPIQILVDGGSSDNFLQPRIAQFLKLDIAPAPLFKVLVGNENSLSPEGSISELCVAVQNHDIKIPVRIQSYIKSTLDLDSDGTLWKSESLHYERVQKLKRGQKPNLFRSSNRISMSARVQKLREVQKLRDVQMPIRVQKLSASQELFRR
ncbi:hypothetical protein TSUD_293180 [Trifolium subterraneum]|uniref:Retrotransposon gag domain-containing protein n=1 Tax=Trifolium subterraneum TaxID=3900 RepID=A0A2Z6M8Y3_TRISU|nr:hypothetical protein TSUD_293180 [Trifolium subterraneum]